MRKIKGLTISQFSQRASCNSIDRNVLPLEEIPPGVLSEHCYGSVDLSDTCKYANHEDCPKTCGTPLNVGRESCRTGLARFTEKYGLNWRSKSHFS